MRHTRALHRLKNVFFIIFIFYLFNLLNMINKKYAKSMFGNQVNEFQDNSLNTASESMVNNLKYDPI